MLSDVCGWLQIMKSDEDVRMISAEAPVLFARVSFVCTWHLGTRFAVHSLLKALRCHESRFSYDKRAV